MSTSLRRRLRAVEKKTYRDEEVVSLTLGDMTFNTTVGESSASSIRYRGLV